MTSMITARVDAEKRKCAEKVFEAMNSEVAACAIFPHRRKIPQPLGLKATMY